MTWTADDYLAHHGILNQRWGHRNGPPYPLSYSDHSAAEKRANPKSIIGGGSGDGLSRRDKRRIQKEAAKQNKQVSKEQAKALALTLGATAGIGIGTAAAYSLSNKKTKVTSEEQAKDLAEKNRWKAIEEQYNKNNPTQAENLEKNLNSAKSQIDSVAKSIENRAKDRPTYKRMDLTEMTNEDLKKAIERENLEINYSKLFNKQEQLTSGERQVKDVLETVGTIIGVTGSALAIALTIKKLMEKSAKTAEKTVAVMA